MADFGHVFGFLLATSSAVIFVVMIAAVTIGFFLALGGVLNAIFMMGLDSIN